MSQLDATLTRVPLTLTFDLDLENSRSNCISGMGDWNVMERKWQKWLGYPDVKHKPLCDPEAEDIVTDGMT